MKNLIVLICYTLMSTGNLLGSDQLPATNWIARGGNMTRLGAANTAQRFAWAMVPNEVITAASMVLDADSKKWKINRIERFAGTQYTIVTISDDLQKIFMCSVDGNVWSRVAIKESTVIIAKILCEILPDYETFKDVDRAERFCGDISYLFKGPKRQVLSKNFQKDHPTIAAWLQGNEKNASRIEELCVGPELKKMNGTYLLTYNVITGFGAAERWSVQGKFRKAGFTIETIELVEINPIGTFSWGNVP